SPRNPEASSTSTRLYLENHWHDQGTALRLLGNVALQIGANLFLHHAPIPHFFGRRTFQRLSHHHARCLDQIGAVVGYGEPARHHFGQRLAASRVLVDRHDRQHDAILGKVAAIAYHDILHHFVDGAGIDANAADRDSLAFPRALLVDLERGSGLEDE